MKYNPLPQWRIIVKKDHSKLSDALEYYLAEMEEARKDLVLEGNLTHITKYHAYHLSRYITHSKELDAMVTMFENELARTKGEVMREWLDNAPTNRVPSPSESKTAIESDERVVTIKGYLEETKYVDNMYDAVMRGWESRGFSIAQLNKLVEHNNTDVEV